MDPFDDAYTAIAASEMNEWVGGGDPRQAGEYGNHLLRKHLDFDREVSVLDYGCGVGRMALSVLKQAPELRRLVGLDIVPALVDFCRSNIGARFPQTRFELLDQSNAHYDPLRNKRTPGQTRQQICERYTESFDCAYAFSVFTHLARADLAPNLKFIGQMLRPGGFVLFTCFILNSYSRAAIANKTTLRKFPRPTYRERGRVFYESPQDKLAFIAFDQSVIDEVITQAGLIPWAIEFGSWRDGGPTGSLQDVVVCRKRDLRG